MPSLRETAPEDEGLKGLARRLTQRRPKKEGASPDWEMKALLAAVESEEPRIHQALQRHCVGGAGNRAGRHGAGPDGADRGRADRAGMEKLSRRRPRHLCAPPGRSPSTKRRWTASPALYRDDARFHEAADAYLGEIRNPAEPRRARAISDGLLVSTPALGRYRQGLSGDRLRAGAALTFSPLSWPTSRALPAIRGNRAMLYDPWMASGQRRAMQHRRMS